MIKSWLNLNCSDAVNLLYFFKHVNTLAREDVANDLWMAFEMWKYIFDRGLS